MSNGKSEQPTYNAQILLWAGFMSILAAGVGFAIRGQVFDIWKETFRFTNVQIGLISGAGMTGFCFAIIGGGIIVDKIGYGKLIVAAFFLHLSSAATAFLVGDKMATETAFALLWTSTFLFALANGCLEAVANPLVATVFPQNRTHYLNILHASWPLGLMLGGFAGYVMGDLLKLGWREQLALFVVPTIIYGAMFFGQRFPKSEASEKGLSLSSMFQDVGILGSAVIGVVLALFVKDGLGELLFGFTANSFFKSDTWTYASIGVGVVVWGLFSNMSGWSIGSLLLFVLFITHALVGAVELGTDGWIQNITGNILSPEQGKILFVFTSTLMFILRFCSHFIEKNLKLSPIGILLTCAILACIGLNAASAISGFGVALGALAIYGVGKTFFWPTMLAVVGDRFPRTGAVAMSIMGGIGMMSAGLIGSPGLGYAKDYFAAKALEQKSPTVYESVKNETPSKFLMFPEVHGLDGSKISPIKKVAVADRTDEQKAIIEADQTGDRRTLNADSVIPATMALIYLGLLAYFASIGGYKPLNIDGHEEAAKHMTEA
jgi:MFS family permease